MQDKDKRDQVEFYLKYGVMMVGAIWLLWSGTDLLDKRARILSREAMPIGSTELTVNPTGSAIRISGKDYCNLSGFYSIENTGKLAFKIDEVEFNIYRLQGVMPSNEDKGKLASYTLSKRLVAKNLVPGSPEKFGVEEVFAPGNFLQRNFGLIVPLTNEDPASRYGYVVSANAAGGLPEPDRGLIGGILYSIYVFLFGSGLNEFGANDLRHVSGTMGICVDPQP